MSAEEVIEVDDAWHAATCHCATCLCSKIIKKETDMLNERIRYSPKGFPKNTLVTLSDGEVIYFGLARCNLDAGDSAFKTRGRTIAKARALRAKVEKLECPKVGVLFHSSGMRGVCPVSDIRLLLSYFDDIDHQMYEDGLRKHRQN